MTGSQTAASRGDGGLSAGSSQPTSISSLLFSSAKAHLQACRGVGVGACALSNQPTDGAEVVRGCPHAICIPGVPGLQPASQAGTPDTEDRQAGRQASTPCVSYKSAVTKGGRTHRPPPLVSSARQGHAPKSAHTPAPVRSQCRGRRQWCSAASAGQSMWTSRAQPPVRVAAGRQ